MTDPINIELPLFSVAELAHVAGLGRGLVDLWVHRGLIKPSRVDRLTIRTRSSFSIATIFETKLVRVLGDRLALGVSDAGGVAHKIAEAVVDDKKWMFNAARHAERGKVFALFAVVSRSGDCWQSVLHVGSDNIRLEFGKDVPEIVAPIGELFYPLYNGCKAILAGQSSVQKLKKARRARS